MPRWLAVFSTRCLYATIPTSISHEYLVDLFDLEFALECPNAADDVCNFSESAVGAFAEGDEGVFYDESRKKCGRGGVKIFPEVVGGGALVEKEVPVAMVRAERAEKSPRFISIIFYRIAYCRIKSQYHK